MKNKTLLADLLLIAVLLLGSLVFLIVRNNMGRTGEWAVVAVNGVEIKRYPLSQDGVFMLNDGTNILEIKDRSARITGAECPDKLCVKQGSVRFSGQCITCLPNRLTVTVEGKDSSVDIIL